MNNKSRLTQAIQRLLFVSGLLCVLLGIGMTFITHVLFDQRHFGSHVVRSIQEPVVAHFLADKISQSVIQTNRDLTPYRPLIFFGAREIISSEAFSPLVRISAEKLHFVIFSQGGKHLRLTIADAGTLLKSALPFLPPKVSKKIPTNLVFQLTDEITITKEISQALPRLKEAASFSKYSGWILALGVLFLILAIVLSTTPWRVGRRTGWFLIFISMCVGILPTTGSILIHYLISDNEIADVVTGIWRSFLFETLDWTFALCGVGLVLLSISDPQILNKLNPSQNTRTLWHWMTTTPDNWAEQFTRGAIIIGAGYSLVKWPIASIEFTGTAIGFYALCIGASLLGNLLFQFGNKEYPPHLAHRQEIKRVSRPVKFSIIITLTLLSGSLILYIKSQGTLKLLDFISTCNGTKALCDRRLDQVVFPTTHNSMASADQPTWFFPAQEAGIHRQLRDGIRGFQIDAHYGYAVKNQILTVIRDESAARRKYESVIGKEGLDSAFRIRNRLIGEPKGEKRIYLCHSFCELGALELRTAFQIMRNFLRENPNEGLMIVIQDEDVLPKDIAEIAVETGLLEFIYQGPASPPWPTLKEMIQKKQQVLIFAENQSGEVPWYHSAFQVFQETPYDFRKISDFSCRPWRGKTKGDLFQMNHWITRVPAPQPRDAQLVNSYDFMMKRTQQCMKERHKIPNLLAVDFYQTGDLLKVVDALNQDASLSEVVTQKK